MSHNVIRYHGVQFEEPNFAFYVLSYICSGCCAPGAAARPQVSRDGQPVSPPAQARLRYRGPMSPHPSSRLRRTFWADFQVIQMYCRTCQINRIALQASFKGGYTRPSRRDLADIFRGRIQPAGALSANSKMSAINACSADMIATLQRPARSQIAAILRNRHCPDAVRRLAGGAQTAAGTCYHVVLPSPTMQNKAVVMICCSDFGRLCRRCRGHVKLLRCSIRHGSSTHVHDHFSC